LRTYTKFVANTGDKFDYWTVIGPAESAKYAGGTLSAVKVKCVCGIEKEILSQSLRDRKSKSCGCKGKPIPDKGSVQGYLTVLGTRYYKDTSSWSVQVRCVCMTSAEFTSVPLSAFAKTGSPLKSCGCKGRFVTDEEAQCTSCRQIKPLSGFPVRSGKSGGILARCKVCDHGQRILKNFNIDIEKYWLLAELQDFKCGICKKDIYSSDTENMFAVDHDHGCCPIKGKSCGKCVRGILCGPCNKALGVFEKGMPKDDLVKLKASLTYFNASRLKEAKEILERPNLNESIRLTRRITRRQS
jgi:hypothetical protein